MTHERLENLISAMEDASWGLFNAYKKEYGENDKTTVSEKIRWLTLREVQNLLKDENYFETMEKIFIKKEA